MQFYKKLLFSTLLILLFAPCFAGAQYFVAYGNFTFTGLLKLLLNLLWQLFAFLAIASFVIAGMFFLFAQGQPAKLETARSFVMWGVVGIIVAILAFSIVTIVGNSLN